MQAIVESTYTSIAEAEIRDLIDSILQTQQENDAVDLVALSIQDAAIFNPFPIAHEPPVRVVFYERKFEDSFRFAASNSTIFSNYATTTAVSSPEFS